MKTPIASLTAFFALGFAACFVAPAANADDGMMYSGDWTGFYVGVHAGGGFADVESDTSGNVVFLPSDYNADGFLGGGLIGWNFIQTGNFVFGVEGDVSFGDVDGDTVTGASTPAFELDATGTVRLRAGFAVDRILLFATVGAAFADVKHQDLGQVAPTSDSNTHSGLVIGGGLEWKVWDNVTIRGEYMYTDYSKERYTVGGIFDPVEFDMHVVRGALIWNFSGM